MKDLNMEAKVLGACFLSGVVLCALKLFNVIDWSWLVVTAPIWGPFVLLLAALCVIAIMWGFVRILRKIADHIEKD